MSQDCDLAYIAWIILAFWHDVSASRSSILYVSIRIKMIIYINIFVQELKTAGMVQWLAIHVAVSWHIQERTCRML